MIDETDAGAANPTAFWVEIVVRIPGELRRFGFTEDEVRWIGRDEVDATVALAV